MDTLPTTWKHADVKTDPIVTPNDTAVKPEYDCPYAGGSTNSSNYPDLMTDKNKAKVTPSTPNGLLDTYVSPLNFHEGAGAKTGMEPNNESSYNPSSTMVIHDMVGNGKGSTVSSGLINTFH